MRLSRSSYLLAEIILILVILVGVLLLITHDWDLFFSILYSPYSFILLVVIILEYIILKGMDRSRIYKLEIERLKRKRHRDLEFHVRMEKQIRELEKYADDPNAGEELKSHLKKILNEFREL